MMGTYKYPCVECTRDHRCGACEDREILDRRKKEQICGVRDPLGSIDNSYAPGEYR